MRLRTIPPAAAPVSLGDIVRGFRGIGSRRAMETLEREVREYFGVEHVFLASSGKAALYLILSGLRRMTARTRVVVPAYTCFTVPSAIRSAGLEVVPCDVRPETLDFDYGHLEELLDEDTLCVVPTHLFGVPSDVDKVRSLCGKTGAYVVEDAAQAMGGRDGGRKLGTLGDVSFFSLGRGKNITCGSGGIILTSSEDIADAIRGGFAEVRREPVREYLKDVVEIVFLAVFLHPSLYGIPKGLPFLGIGETRYHPDFPVWAFTGFKAGLLHDWRKKLERFNALRAATAEFYSTGLGLSADRSAGARGVAWNRFPLFVGGTESKRRLCREGDRDGISPMYPSPIQEIPELAGTFGDSRHEGAARIAETLVTLPTHALLTGEDRERVLGLAKPFHGTAERFGQGRPH